MMSKNTAACLIAFASCFVLVDAASALTMSVPVSNSNFAILGTPPNMSNGWQNFAPYAADNLWTISNPGFSSTPLYQAQIGPADHITESLNAVLLGNAKDLSQDLNFHVSWRSSQGQLPASCRRQRSVVRPRQQHHRNCPDWRSSLPVLFAGDHFRHDLYGSDSRIQWRRSAIAVWQHSRLDHQCCRDRFNA